MPEYLVERNVMTRAFRDGMAQLYPIAEFPHGIPPHQLKNEVRIFLMGYAEGIKQTPGTNHLRAKALQEWVDQYGVICDLNWFPGPEWRWWPQ